MMWDSARGPIAVVVCVFLISQSSCHHPDLSGGMTGNNSFTLCCTKIGGWGLTGLYSVFWYRNGTLVFKTRRLLGTQIVDSSFRNSVKPRLWWRRHCVDVSKVEAGISKWRCNNDNDKSTWSEKSIQLSGFTAGVTPFEPFTETPVRGNVTLNVYPEKIFDDTNFTLSCTVETLMQINISNMVWLQNQTEMIVTFSNRSHIILDNSTSPVVIETTQSDNQHNLTLEADLDGRNGTAWTCAIPVLSATSNTVLVQVLEPIGNVTLKVYPEEVYDGSNFTLMCTVEAEIPTRAFDTIWLQNNEEYIVTFSNRSYHVSDNSTFNVIREFRPSGSQHILTLEAHSGDLNATSWTCGIEKRQWLSNNVTVTVLEQVSTTSDSTSTLIPPASNNSSGRQSSDDNTQLYTILGTTVGVVVLAVIIAVAVIRNRKTEGELKETKTSRQRSLFGDKDEDVLEMKDNNIYESSPTDRHAVDDDEVMKENTLYESSPPDINHGEDDKETKDNFLYESSPIDSGFGNSVMTDNVLDDFSGDGVKSNTKSA
ncbi:uncharacterized protein LOC124126951 isoform X2 [Haliotis rufescens]|uniref:uncharacterized protein LOC124126951 isoform X3 n=1 Tax=Haliotis rufescens TaxID=6454 RepID=UPI00201F1C58|nr:uncharacterized protein LOC124126951 isoform X3 [Haliotis rufescens]XP_046346431.2 uncharacterized protein LOC124126951 isoform X2 [Haliotis rufescens]